MISGKMNLVKKYKQIAFLFLTLFISAHVHALELPELLHMFAQQQQSTVDFNEEKYTFYLDEPIKSSGYLQFIAPNKLSKFILKPEKISQRVSSDILEINNADITQTINLNDHPEFSIILRAIISLLSGDLATLKKDFKIIFKNKSSKWTLILSPHDSYVSDYVETIKMSGNKNKLTKIVVIEPNNDHSITHLYNHR